MLKSSMIKVTRFYQNKIDEEISVLGSNKGPLYKAIYSEKIVSPLPLKGESADFINDKANIPEGLEDFVIHKYKDRIIFIPSIKCAAHCQYCFRENILSNSNLDEELSLEAKVEKTIAYLNCHKNVKEFILSGGDPLTLRAEKLEYIIEKVLQETSIKDIRIHTRAIIFSPQMISVKKIKIFSKAHVRFVAHSIHPYEICDEVKEKIRELQAAKIVCYNQFPLLRGINDHRDVLVKHLKLLDSLGIRNLSIFIPEPIYHSAPFRISLPRIFALIDDVNWTTPSWINSTRFVLDSQYGKMRREDLKSYDAKSGLAVFQREGKEIEYWDFPNKLDVAGERGNMLWKG